MGPRTMAQQRRELISEQDELLEDLGKVQSTHPPIHTSTHTPIQTNHPPTHPPTLGRGPPEDARPDHPRRDHLAQKAPR